MSWTNGLVSFLSLGIFSFEMASMKIIFAEVLLDIFSDGRNGLGGKVERVGAVIGDKTGLV